MKRTSILSLCVALLLSCGFAHAAPEPQHYLYLSADYHSFSAHDVAAVGAVRALALMQWRHEASKDAMICRSDMHATGAGLVFTAIHAEPMPGSSRTA